MPVVAELSGERIELTGDVEDHLVKAIPGARYRREWTVPRTVGSCLALRAQFGRDLRIGDDLRDWAADAFNDAQRLRELKRSSDEPGDLGLWAWQRAGVAFLTAGNGGLLFDDMGAGKTWTGVKWLTTAPGRRLVVAPTTIIGVWTAALARLAPDWRVSVVDGTKAQRAKALEDLAADVHVISWANLATHSRQATWGGIALTVEQRRPKELQALGFKTVLADEAHRAKRPEAAQTRALWALGDAATHRAGLTGTPIENKPQDLWSLLRFVAPDDFPARTVYIDRYLEQSWTGWGLEVTGVKAERRAEWLGAVDHHWRRAVLPKTVYSDVAHQDRVIPMTSMQRRQYDGMRKQLIAEIPPGKSLVAWDPLQKGLRLWQISQTAVDENGAPRLPSNKLEAFADLLDECAGTPVVAFAHHSRVLRLFEKELSKPLGRPRFRVEVIDGDTPRKRRDEIVAEHQRGELDAVLLTYGAGGEGITLTRGNVVCLIEGTHKASSLDQAIRRVARPGQERRVQVVSLISEKGWDGHVRRIAEGKGDHLNELIGREEAMAWLS